MAINEQKIKENIEKIKKEVIKNESNIITMAISKFFAIHKDLDIEEHGIKYFVYDPAEFFNKYPNESERTCIIDFKKGEAVLDINSFPFIKNDFLAIEELITGLTCVIIYNSLNRLDRFKLKKYGYSSFVNYFSMKIAIYTMKNINTSFRNDYKTTNERKIFAKKVLSRYTETKDISTLLYGIAILENTTINKESILNVLQNYVEDEEFLNVISNFISDYNYKNFIFTFNEIKKNDKILNSFNN